MLKLIAAIALVATLASCGSWNHHGDDLSFALSTVEQHRK